MGDETDGEMEHLKNLVATLGKHVANLEAWKNDAKQYIDAYASHISDYATLKQAQKMVDDASEDKRITTLEGRVTKLEAKTKNLK